MCANKIGPSSTTEWLALRYYVYLQSQETRSNLIRATDNLKSVLWFYSSLRVI
jgi:hypothetical protein